MKWSWRIARLAGIDVYVHSTFLILLAWVALSHYLESRNVAAMMAGLLFILTLFGVIVLHELGHALTARRFGIRTRDITLLPIGGVARLERMPDDPRQELLVALAGPAVNVVIAAALLALLQLTSGLEPLGALSVTQGSFVERIMLVNMFLAAFNLLPAFPMDGGRALRAILAMRMDYVRATQMAANIGQGMALLFGFVGLFLNPFLLFIALFVWLGASEEAAMVQMKSALGGVPLVRAMITNFHTLSPHEPLSRAVADILAGFQQDFPVVEDKRVVGVLTRADLLRALADHAEDSPVSNVMRRDFATADVHEMLETVAGRLSTGACQSLPVTRDGGLVGMITMENVGEFVMIQGALSEARQRRGARREAG